MPSRDDELGGLWLKTSQGGKRYMSGRIDGVDVVVFKNEHKQDGERTPDYRVYRSQPRGDAKPAEQAPGKLDDLDDEIPF
jgi:uncharacterized protein (DUF736 family)